MEFTIPRTGDFRFVGFFSTPQGGEQKTETSTGFHLSGRMSGCDDIGAKPFLFMTPARSRVFNFLADRPQIDWQTHGLFKIIPHP